jgi:hypothetical protein
MKKLFLLLVIFAGLCNCSRAQPIVKDFAKLQWLIGEWKLTNAKPGTSGMERWLRGSDTELHGVGITTRGSDTAFIERTKLIIKDSSVYYVADIPENKELIYFKVTTMTDHSFICENAKHDFPKKIMYVNQGSALKATISGNGKSIDYLFEKTH